jgi:uncharacterized protein YbaR (Trm112 family)
MRAETIEKLCCPFDKSDLQLKTVATDLQKNVTEGILFCGHCQRVYPIVKGIPIMSPDEFREFRLEQPLLDRWTEGRVTADFRLIPGQADETKSLT